MSWTAITKEELEALIRKGLEEADDAVLAAWNTIRIEPEKWQCSPEGDLGGGFWAVAIRNGLVTYFNDIEDGFNESPFVEHGVIGKYRCNQHDFTTYLMTLAEARKAEDWFGDEGTTAVPMELIGVGRIVKRQSTYWTLENERGNVWRVHFIGKVEMFFDVSYYPAVTITDDHPLLMQHDEPHVSVYFKGKPEDLDAVEVELRSEVSRVTGGCRRYESYRSGGQLADGFGLLAEGPVTVVQAIADVLRRWGVSPSTFEGNAKKLKHRILLLGRSFVIAEEFRFERRGD